jgi:PKD repeat protein/outer membrane protein assembly factor BamB
MERILLRTLVVFVTVITLLIFCLVFLPFVHSAVAQDGIDEWTQHGHDSQRTSYSPNDVAGPWRYRWQWNGADASGRGGADWVPVRRLVQPITGGGRVYVVAGWAGGEPDEVHALAKTNGEAVWSEAPGGELFSTPAYGGEWLFVASENGTLYKLNASNGNTVDSFEADSALRTPPLLVGDRVYVTSEGGTLYAISKSTMDQIWAYSAGAQAATMPAYSTTRDMVIFCDRELYVHAVKANGQRAWRVKPTNREPFYGHPTAEDLGANQASFDYGWPVVADGRGVVLVRLRLNWDTLWGGPGDGGSFPTTNAAIRQFLEDNPSQQTLFAVDLDDGSRAFTPAVGNSAWEGDNSLELTMGPQPAIRRLDNGREVAYIIWRNGQVNPEADGRWDATMGEMVLDSSTVSGYQAGDLRFVSTQFIPTDESGTVTAAGSFVFHSQWLVMCSSDLGDRSGGDSYSNAIGGIGPYVIWAQAGGTECSFNADTRWCNSLYTENDTRAFGAGFYILFDEPTRYSSDPYAWNYAPSVVVSDGMIIIKSVDGAIFVLEYEQVNEPLSAGFTAVPRDGPASLEVQFTDLSAGNPTAWMWDFGDGSPSAFQQHPAHTYTIPDTYTVTLTVTRTDPVESDTAVSSNFVTVTAPPLQADFAAVPRDGPASLEVQFTDLSAGNPTAWMWDFGDGSLGAFQEHPVHTYTIPDTYTVTLTVTRTDPVESDTAVSSNFVTVTAPPLQANFTAQPRFGSAPLNVQFTDLSIGDVLTRVWDFGQGEGTVLLPPMASSLGPIHTYHSLGYYTVSLTIQDAYTSDTLVLPRYIYLTDGVYSVYLPTILRDYAPR